MVLEAVMIMVDNSESSRNGDYAPTRFDAQADAVGILFQNITQGNPESSVGLMAFGGKGPEVLATLTTDQGKILDGLHRTKKKISGTPHLGTGIQVAQLALKHRQNNSQRPRIIAFVCSLLDDTQAELVKLAKKMKKSNLTVDFVLFGDMDDGNQEKLEAFHNEVKSSGEGSHLVVIPPSNRLLSDQLISSAIMLGDNATGGGSGGDVGSSAEDFPFGVDPATDPELALALRMSMEEEKARQEKLAREEAAKSAKEMDAIEEEAEALLRSEEEGKENEEGKSKEKKDDNDKGDKMDTS
ncbi:hypothetical protein QBC38DRAFT_467697 [Podospora fimiseda]|uniref:VWFA domain-containing protein n=1 Tax=Podospora fimiseda TaxID=252190 RepID=A0AAN7H4Q1_9PEZI|nr:hypothetical protein QBC38DRAFT_467697 [Podospora fimiseda]